MLKICNLPIRRFMWFCAGLMMLMKMKVTHEDSAEMRLFDVSLSPYNIQDYEDCGEDQIEKLPLQGPIAQFVEAFVEQHFTPEVFVKRKRDKARIDADTQRGGDRRLARQRPH